jgi:hypothetical protein
MYPLFLRDGHGLQAVAKNTPRILKPRPRIFKRCNLLAGSRSSACLCNAE